MTATRRTLTGRTPRYAAFLGTGTVLGLVAALALVSQADGAGGARPRLLLYLAALLAGCGALLGGAVAVVLEARRHR